ncbi:uncharacterized protein LOC119792876 [Cyprinodon tularosa]|uniref:uncharacterized protein LOC119792876 n=1 Tax=Cyprinodon tularosa TaxID=77115 RepID=UPI0018E20218|nr:uncharacterized protein LOC119792876 [Cyprinodon tularosa]
MSETKSQKTQSKSVLSLKSSKASSTAGIELLRAKAKAEAAQARATYAKKEIEIKVEQVRLQATLDALRAEQEQEAAAAEANSLDAGLLQLGFETRSVTYGSCLTEKKATRTAQYVLDQANLTAAESPVPFQIEINNPELPLQTLVVKQEINYAAPESEICEPQSTNFKQFAPLAPVLPKVNHAHNSHVETQPTYDLARYLARSQLVTTGLTSFDDQPMNYWAWKSSFKTAITGLDLSAGEELDLLVRYLGENSSRQVKQMKAVNIRRPEAGLAMAWERLEEVYGSPEAIEQALFQKVENFPKITPREPFKLRDLADLMLELEAAKLDGYLPGLSYLDTSRGIQPIVNKLPYNLQEKWMTYGSKYKRDHGVSFPPFTVFANFIRAEAKTRTDPSFTLHSSNQLPERKQMPERFSKVPISVHKTQIQDKAENKEKITNHLAKNCTTYITCTECDSNNHISALHPGPAPQESKTQPPLQHGGESSKADVQEVTSRCTEVYGEGVSARECSKIILVNVYPAGHKEQTKRMYAILDEQSNRSLARSQFFELFQIQGASYPYTLKTCAGLTGVSGRRAGGFMVESINEQLSLPLPTLLECNDIPNNRSEIPTPQAASHHAHLQRIADKIPPLDSDADILLLLGRDVLRVHKVREQVNGPGDSPFAQKLDLGWVVVGEVCLDGKHRPTQVSSYKTFVLENGRASQLQPCNSRITVKETFTETPELSHSPRSFQASGYNVDSIGQQVFAHTPDDYKLAQSVEDMQFLQIMDSEFYQDSDNSWVGPLPFRSPRQRLPNNRQLAYNRLMSLRRSLRKRPEMKAHFLEFMENMLTRGHAEVAPSLVHNQECWP